MRHDLIRGSVEKAVLEIPMGQEFSSHQIFEVLKSRYKYHPNVMTISQIISRYNMAVQCGHVRLPSKGNNNGGMAKVWRRC